MNEKTSFERVCPKCGKTLYHTLENNRNMAQKRNQLCVSCSRKGKSVSEETRIKIGNSSRGKTYEERYGKETASRLKNMRKEARKGKIFSAETKQKMSETRKGRIPWNKGVPCSEETKIKISKSEKGKIIPEYLKLLWSKQRAGKKKSPTSDIGRKNIRLGRIKWIIVNKNKGHPIYPTYNKEACKIIDEYGKKHGYNFRHALNGGEYYIKKLGFWVDGYDRNRNSVIEVDEPYHFASGSLRIKDQKRQEEIQNLLKCSFIRIKIDKLNNIENIQVYSVDHLYE